MDPKIHAKFVDDLNFFHSERKNGFSKYINVLQSLKNFWKIHIIGIIAINLIIALGSFFFQTQSNVPGTNIPLLVTYLLSNTSFVFFSFVRFLFLKSQQIFFKNSLENRFAGNKMVDVQHALKKIAVENDCVDDFERFIYNIQKGSLNKENIDFYISMIEAYFHANESTLLTFQNVPSAIAINLDEKSSNKIKDFAPIEFFDKKDKHVYQKK